MSIGDETQVMYGTHIEASLRQWWDKAKGNVEKWGLQSLPTLLLATQEELSEIGEEVEGDLESDTEELLYTFGHMVDTGMHVQATHESLYEDENGDPLDEDPTLELGDDVDLDRIEDEVKDTAALLIQIQAAIEEKREE